MNLTGQQIRTIVAAYLGWMLDAFDFFLLTFVLRDIAKEFGVDVASVAYALFLTLAMRFIGAFIFGRIGDKFGRRPALMLDILSYSVIGAAAAFSPNLTVFLVLRALFGVAMGGEWGLGSSLAMESISPQARGTVSGILQCGYPSGFLLAAIAFGLIYGRHIGDYEIGWRAMFLLSVLPALVVLFIRTSVTESPAFEAAHPSKLSLSEALEFAGWMLMYIIAAILLVAEYLVIIALVADVIGSWGLTLLSDPIGYLIGWWTGAILVTIQVLLFVVAFTRKTPLGQTIEAHFGLVVYMVVLMMCFNLFSHGTQDLYPTFLQKQHNFNPGTVSWITIVANLGAIAGGLTFGHISERIGRVNAITVATAIALPTLPLWAYSTTPALLALGAFIMQVAVQGAWGIVPAHLNELSPGAARATIPAFVYQAGNFLASYNGPFQAKIAEANGGNYAFALALVAGVVAVAMIVVIRFSPERRGEHLVAH